MTGMGIWVLFGAAARGYVAGTRYLELQAAEREEELRTQVARAPPVYGQAERDSAKEARRKLTEDGH